MKSNGRRLKGIASFALLAVALCPSIPVTAGAANSPVNRGGASDGLAPGHHAVQKQNTGQRFVQVRLQFIRVNTRGLAERVLPASDSASGDVTDPVAGNGLTQRVSPFASGSAALTLFSTLKHGQPDASVSFNLVTPDNHPASVSFQRSFHCLGVTAGEENKPVSESINVTVTPRTNIDHSITLRLTWSDVAAEALREHGKEAGWTAQNGEMIMLRAFPIDAQTEMLLLATPTTILGLLPEAIKIDGGDGLTGLRPPSSKKIMPLFKEDLGSGLLPIGTTAPDFTLPTPQGKEVSFGTVLQGNKALILSFWFIGCPPCREELPHLQDLYNQFHSRGLGILAINNRGDGPAAVATFMQKNKLVLPVALDSNRVPDIYQDRKTWRSTISGKYRAGGAPIIYIIGPSGKVVWREIGYDAGTDKRLRRVLATLGVN